MNVNNFLAKSEKYGRTTMIDHGNMVSEASDKLSKIIMIEEQYLRYKEILHHTSLVHDIGKLTDSFQKFLNNPNKRTRKPKFEHNEIGWAFLSKYYKGKNKDILLYITFWHHGIVNFLKKKQITDDDIINTLNDNEIKNMSEYLVAVLGKKFLQTDVDILNSEVLYIPLYNPSTTGILYQWKILYGCLVSGDRIASHKIFYGIDFEIDKYFSLSKKYDPIKNWNYSGTTRSNKQIEIVNKCLNTTMINAPAGFGKTIIGLLWGLKREKKLLWVCPRNTIAENVYDAVKIELSEMNISPSIELILGGRIKKGGNGSLFQSDIIVTNIDNFLAPSINNSLLIYYSLINRTSVIFDEYHEFIGGSALFSAFVNIMQGRHQMTNSETLLLSATSNNINYLWEGNNLNKKNTNILPGIGKHYDAQHSIPYKLNVFESVDFSNLKPDNSLIIYNAIKNSQIEKRKNDYIGLYHSKFTDSDRENALRILFNKNGKNGTQTIEHIVGTHILQASLDVSFNNVFESCLSPESTIQRWGRDNRWGDMHNCTFSSVLLKNRSERSAISTLYNSELNKKWFNFILQYSKTNNAPTLDDMYLVYNEFHLKYSNDIKKMNKKLLHESKLNLENVFPSKYSNSKSYAKKGIYVAGTNKLRSNGDDTFFIIKNTSDDGWSDAFSEEVFGDFDKHFNEDPNVLNKMFKVMKELESDDRFDFSEILKSNKYGTGVSLDELRRRSKMSITPYIRFDQVYDDELGIISKDLLKEIK